jgi:hypothetical protein
LSHDLCSVGKIRAESYDDDDSIFTLSTASLSDSDSEIERRVSFADDLVTDEWTRPYTPKELIPTLYYSPEETSRFRQEYRLERKLLNDLSIDPVSSDDLLSSLTSTLSSSSAPSFSSSSSVVPTPRHRISRVVVLHNDKLVTFSDDEATSNDDDECSDPCGPLDFDDDSSNSPALPANFFDNDSFWSGSITWY